MSRPWATYRLQFRDGMTFDRAAELAPYWRRLGISHLYASPVFAALAGSSHGYDVTDFNRLDPDLGGEAGFLRLSEALKNEGLGLVLDVVPNHMSASPENPWWRDVLEWGRQSRFAGHFDIDWSAERLLLPVLGRSYAEALEEGELTLSVDAGAGRLLLRYFGLSLPLSPSGYPLLLKRLNDKAVQALAGAFAASRPETAADAQARLATLLGDTKRRAAVETALARLTADHTLVHRLHESQIWRLVHWRAARDSLTYRRFFEISDLVGVRVEDPAVFDDVHRLVLDLVAEGRVDGIRVDHIDGLADPKGYLERLRQAIGSDRQTYVVVEKILEADETLRSDWPADGTTGYEFITAMSRLLTTDDHVDTLDQGYRDRLGRSVDYPTLVRDTKREILTHNLASELSVLTRYAKALAQGRLATRDFGEDSLRRAIIALICAFPVYRSYVDGDGAPPRDRAMINGLAEAAAAAREIEDPATVGFVTDLLLLDLPDDQRQDALRFAARFQQTTGPVMAKALEDTVFYRYNRLVALNEVGGDPVRLGGPADAVHALMAERRQSAPQGLSATATHDTKRGEDARARLYALSEAPEVWSQAVRRWSGMNARLVTKLPDGPAPGPETEWLIYQALLGVWPADLAPDDAPGLTALSERFAGYLEKAVREAKTRTRWTAPSAPYEQAVRRFADGLLDPDNHAFLADFVACCRPFWMAGALNGLVQTLLKLTAPGVPDIYQGTESWDFSLVDPDNRRPVDFALRSAILDEAPERRAEAPLDDWQSGAVKMRLLQAGLTARRMAPSLFADGDYHPLAVHGRRSGHVFAFARAAGDQAAIVIAPRLPLALLGRAVRPIVAPDAWKDTAVEVPEKLAGRRLTDRLTGRAVKLRSRLPLAAVLDAFPVALLH